MFITFHPWMRDAGALSVSKFLSLALARALSAGVFVNTAVRQR
jgi:hypothetical protein